MAYTLIDNLSKTNNHLTRIKQLFEASDTVILASPFLMHDISDFFKETNTSHLTKIHIVTTLVPKSSDQIKKIHSLYSFIQIPQIKDNITSWQVSLNNKLHGKIYIFKKSGVYVSAIISSANFTENGLHKNHEWGVEISEIPLIRELEKSIIGSIEIERLSVDEIIEMQKVAKIYLDHHPNTSSKDIDLILTNILLTPDHALFLDHKINYWLKPIGYTDSPIKEGELFDSTNVGLGNLNFSKRRPSGIKINDILIIYGVGSTKILSIYRVTSTAQHVTDEEIEEVKWYKRWPWYVTGENLTPIYGGIWWNHNLRIGELASEYLISKPDMTLTKVGGKTLGAFNYHNDKLNLSLGFAKFLITKVIEINNKVF